jgi:hypothetical protein
LYLYILFFCKIIGSILCHSRKIFLREIALEKLRFSYKKGGAPFLILVLDKIRHFISMLFFFRKKKMGKKQLSRKKVKIEQAKFFNILAHTIIELKHL